ncbi:sigma 54 modulation/S30EA ribosomal C-terminal domain-containing protein [Nocardia sp. NPDC127526]|uniref:sigma 54 modulation/S30EA ribosomal C-terminal domain-containing protein n=1 Tax=Nocardia sp. NPDC127526 TaxID=3345393 RepID=UPI0036408927
MAAEQYVEVAGCGDVTAMQVMRARRMIGQVMHRHHLDGPARVRLSGGSTDGRTVTQVTLRFGHTPVRTQADGPGGFALTFAAERLDRQLDRLTGRSAPRWSPDPNRAPLAYVTADRPIVRRKAAALRTCGVVAAVAAMDAMDYEAHLFTDTETGEDAIVYWAGPLGVRMARQRRTKPPRDASALQLTMNPHPTRILTESEAALRLCGYGLPFLFYTDPADSRGRLLYRRYDGDLGLVLPTAG